MSTASGPTLVERRTGGDRRRAAVQDEVDGFVENCRAGGQEVEVQTQREMLSCHIVAENEKAVLVRTITGRETLLFRGTIVSIAVSTSPKRAVPSKVSA